MPCPWMCCSSMDFEVSDDAVKPEQTSPSSGRKQSRLLSCEQEVQEAFHPHLTHEYIEMQLHVLVNTDKYYGFFSAKAFHSTLALFD